MDDNFDVELEKLDHLDLIKSIIKDFGYDTSSCRELKHIFI